MKKCLYLFLCLLLCSLCISCATKQAEVITVTETVTEAVVQTEYIPTYTDLTQPVLAILNQRPNNAEYTVITGENLKTTWDLMHNSWSYQCAWEDWQSYAETLEEFLVSVRNQIADPSAQLVPIIPGEIESEKTGSTENFVKRIQ